MFAPLGTLLELVQRARLRAPLDVVARRALAAVAATRSVVPWSLVARAAPEAQLREALLVARFLVDVPGAGLVHSDAPLD
jgi:hypothetical protein